MSEPVEPDYWIVMGMPATCVRWGPVSHLYHTNMVACSTASALLAAAEKLPSPHFLAGSSASARVAAAAKGPLLVDGDAAERQARAVKKKGLPKDPKPEECEYEPHGEE